MDELVPRPIASIYNFSERNTDMSWLIWFDQLQKKINELVEANGILAKDMEDLKKE
jgi:hypothetical protein